MQITTEHMKAWFTELNGMYFNGELPVPRLKTGNSRTQAGSMSCKYRRFPGVRKCYDFCIRLSNYYDISEDEFRNVFMHEMIHYYIAVKGLRDTSPHGTLFRRIMNSLNARGWHITVTGKGSKPVAEHNRSRIRTRLILSLTDSGGRRMLSVVSPRYARAVDRTLSNAPEVVSHSWHVSADSVFSTWPAVRTARARRVSEADYADLLSRTQPFDIYGQAR